ncbi:thioredoxin family protein [bacterium]|jgi:thioredoxin|nr:thioredoxin family protein [bacterium]
MNNITTQQLFSKGFTKQGDKKWSYNGSDMCVLDFYADWCIPCKNLDVLLNDISDKNHDIKFYKINVEDEYELTELFNIQSVPTLIIVSKNQEPIIITGTISRTKLEGLLKTKKLTKTS